MTVREIKRGRHKGERLVRYAGTECRLIRDYGKYVYIEWGNRNAPYGCQVRKEVLE